MQRITPRPTRSRTNMHAGRLILTDEETQDAPRTPSWPHKGFPCAVPIHFDLAQCKAVPQTNGPRNLGALTCSM